MQLKPGVKTSEFWVTIGLGLCPVILSALGQLDGEYAAAAVTILGGIYTAVRGLLKSRQLPPST